MGAVYRARDTRLDRTVALKVSKADFSDRFAREARAIAALNHPNICTLYDVGPNYLVMEHIEGAKWKGPLPVEKVIEFDRGNKNGAAPFPRALITAYLSPLRHAFTSCIPLRVRLREYMMSGPFCIFTLNVASPAPIRRENCNTPSPET